MENIEKNNCLETAKNRLDIDGLNYLDNTNYVYDRIVTDTTLKNIIPLVKNNNGEDVLRYKNLMNQYNWLVNNFIPSCTYQKLCLRNNEGKLNPSKSKRKWINFTDYSELRGECIVKFVNFDYSVVSVITIQKGTILNNIPSATYEGHVFNGWYTEHSGGELFDFTQPINDDVIIYAQFDIQQVTVTFIYYVGTIRTETQYTLNYGESVTNPPSGNQREGYTFLRWDKPYSNIKQDTEINAVYQINEYTVKFYTIVNIESEVWELIEINTQKVKYGHVAMEIAGPIQQHYTFEKWVDNDTLEDIDFQYITKDINAIPKYVAESYSVIFKDWNDTILPVEIGGESVSAQTVEYLQNAILPNEPTRPNYTFNGWDKSYTGITSDTIINAQYIGESINITYMLPNVEGTGFEIYTAVTVNYNATAIMPSIPSKEDYNPFDYGIFEGWYSDQTLTQNFDFSTHIVENTIIYGKWKQEFEVSFYNWDGTLITGETVNNPQLVRYGDSADDSTIIEYIEPKEQYEFIGWNNSITGITSDTRLTAQFNDYQTYYVIWVNGIDGSVITGMTVEAGDSISIDNYPQPEEIYGYNFSNWEGNTQYIYENKVITAIYDNANFNVKYVDYNGNKITTELISYLSTGYTPESITVPTIEVYDETEPWVVNTIQYNGEFLYVNESGQTIEQTPEQTIIYGDTIFKAQYDIISSRIETNHVDVRSWDGSYTLNYDIYHGTILDSEWCLEQKEMIENALGSRGTEYRFIGFEDENGVRYNYEDGIKVNSDVVLTMRYEVVSYKITYKDSINNEVFATDYVLLNNKANVPTMVPIIQHYQFNNKYYIEGTSTEWNFDDIVTNDVTLIAEYIGAIYELTFNTDGGTPVQQTQSGIYPFIPTRPETEPSKPNYTFIDWRNENTQEIFDFTIPLDDNTTAKALYELNTYTYIYYTSNDGNPVIPENTSWGGAVYVDNELISGNKYRMRFTNGPITEIGDRAFYTKGNLDTIVIPYGVTKLGFESFDYTRLKILEIPETIATIEQRAFTHIWNEQQRIIIICKSETVPTFNGTLILYQSDPTTVYVPYVSLNEYREASYEGQSVWRSIDEVIEFVYNLSDLSIITNPQENERCYVYNEGIEYKYVNGSWVGLV